eukprot:TRINITY_DN1840_c0_g1_i2.p1 TRINITY_DN1840_c0_g1~~TRINITY_DN1840_c0_g1_i2.p1  ORF type:complete len:231 (-),score=39.12 TRINITY_DN1840_c0_g1_i2:73-765(-)
MSMPQYNAYQPHTNGNYRQMITPQTTPMSNLEYPPSEISRRLISAMGREDYANYISKFARFIAGDLTKQQFMKYILDKYGANNRIVKLHNLFILTMFRQACSDKSISGSLSSSRERDSIAKELKNQRQWHRLKKYMQYKVKSENLSVDDSSVDITLLALNNYITSILSSCTTEQRRLESPVIGNADQWEPLEGTISGVIDQTDIYRALLNNPRLTNNNTSVLEHPIIYPQ